MPEHLSGNHMRVRIRNWGKKTSHQQTKMMQELLDFEREHDVEIVWHIDEAPPEPLFKVDKAETEETEDEQSERHKRDHVHRTAQLETLRNRENQTLWDNETPIEQIVRLRQESMRAFQKRALNNSNVRDALDKIVQGLEISRLEQRVQSILLEAQVTAIATKPGHPQVKAHLEQANLLMDKIDQLASEGIFKAADDDIFVKSEEEET